MSKFTDSVKTALKAYFETGDQPTEAQFAEVFDRIQEGIQEHGHTASGGVGAGSGDAGPVVNLQSGTAASKPANPEVGDVYLETDTSKLYACFSAGEWTEIVSGSGGAPDDASYITVNAEEGLSAETQHANLLGAELHDPKAHTHVEDDVTDLDHDAQAIKGKSVDAPVADDDGKFLQYDHSNSKYTHAQAEGRLLTVGAGDNLCVSSDGEKETTSTSYVKAKEIKVYRPGTYRIKFGLKAYLAGITAYGRIYRNGSPVGSERSTTNITYETFSEDIEGWEEGDLIQLYYYRAGGDGSHGAVIRNFRVYYDQGPLDGYVTLS